MDRRLVLHVGTMKSGTSYLQSLLFSQQEHLRAQGVLVPGTTWTDQVLAVRSALGAKPAAREWKAMAAEVAGFDGDAVVSMEYLGPARPAAIGRVLEPYADRRVEVVVTARDLNRTLVSMWQETVQNGRPWTWAEYYGAAERNAPGEGDAATDRTTPGGTFWRQQHLAGILRAWSDQVGVENVTLVTLPQPGAPSSTLTERFMAATGLPIDPAADVPRANESLGLASTLVLREVNAALHAQGFDGADGQRLRKHVLSKTVLPGLTRDEPRLGLPVADWVRHQTTATAAAIERLGVRVVGDLADLAPVEVAGIQPEDVPLADQLRAATLALTEALAHHPGLLEARKARQNRAARRA